MKKALKILLNIIKYTVLLIFILYVAVLAIQKITDNKKALGGYRIFTIVSESMVPDYNIGDIILIKEVDIKTIKKGNDMCYLGKEGDFKDKVVTHRVKEVINNDNKISFITEGIANVMPDPEVSADQVFGIVTYKTKILSIVSKLLSNKLIFFLVVFGPIFGYIFYIIWKMISEKIDEEDDEDEEE